MPKITLTKAEWRVVKIAMHQGADWTFSLYDAWGNDKSKEGRAYLRDYNRIHRVRNKIMNALKETP